jgi:hypothetical protein
MAEMKNNESKDISTEYITKFFHEEARMFGFMHVKIQHIRNIMKAWKAESRKQDKGDSESE